MNQFPVKSKVLTERARTLRINGTDAERKLWHHLRNRQLAGCKFRRQYSACGYILDFACEELWLGIELDDGQHNDAPARRYDETRTQKLQQVGWTILRFWNNDVFDCAEGVLIRIAETAAMLAQCCPSPDARERGATFALPSGASTSPKGEVSEPASPFAHKLETRSDTSPLGEVGAVTKLKSLTLSVVAPGEGQH